MQQNIPILRTPALIVLCGVSGAGKSTFAEKAAEANKWAKNGIIKSDKIRAMVADSEHDMSMLEETFDVIKEIARHRLHNNKLTVIDSTMLRSENRQDIADLAKECGVPAYLIFINPPPAELNRRRSGTDKQLSERTYRKMTMLARDTERSIQKGREKDRFHQVFELASNEDEANFIEKTEFQPSIPTIPQDNWIIVGDVHACADELESLLKEAKEKYPDHKVAFLGDLLDFGPKPVETVKIAQLECEKGGIVIRGNHDNRAEKIKRENAEAPTTSDFIKQEYEETKKTIKILEDEGLIETYLKLLPTVPHIIIGKEERTQLALVHGAMRPHMVGKYTKQVWKDSLYGILTDEISENQLPVRADWQGAYVKGKGKTPVAAGHNPVAEIKWRGNTINLDGGVYGGKLAALIWPENEILTVDAKTKYRNGNEDIIEEQKSQLAEKIFRIPDPEKTLRIKIGEDKIAVSPERLKAALGATGEIQPWHLWWIAPTISPAPQIENDTTPWLEHPAQAIQFYRRNGVNQIVAQTKHMGSRATALICRTTEIAKVEFSDPTTFTLYSRSLRNFFDNEDKKNREFEEALSTALTQTMPNWDWALIDMEVMPWSLKSEGLITNYFLPTGLAQKAYRQTLNQMKGWKGFAEVERIAQNEPAATAYLHEMALYGQPETKEQWSTGIFDILAYQEQGQRKQGWTWPANQLNNFVSQLHQQNPTRFRPLDACLIDLQNEKAETLLMDYWQKTWTKGEGIVVKPNYAEGNFNAHPAIKVRNPDYLRIIYGVDYLNELAAHRQRNIGRKLKTSATEYKIDRELIKNLVERKAWQDCHQLALMALAIDQEPLDPRL